MATVLVLGAGLCCPPLVHYLDKKGYLVRVGSRTLDKAESIVKGTQAAVALKINVEDEGDLLTLEEEIKKSNAVVSMLPYLFHVVPAKLAIKYGKHFLTTSYVSDAMKQLDEEAKAKGVVLINECGVDPGMDHMSAMRIIHNVQAKGGKVVSFRSYCGGLPASDCNNNPFGYKFSWAPRGVLLAARNNATFLENGKQVVIPSKELFSRGYHKINVPGSGEYEAYPNRDSVSYIATYKVEGIATMIRGTLRNEGWCKVMQAMVDLDLLSLDNDTSLAGKKYSSLLADALGNADLKVALAQKLGVGVDNKIIQQFDFLGLFSDEPIPEGVTTKLDAISSAMLKRMQYAPGEKDLIVMKHEFVVEYGDKKEGINSTLVLEGEPNGPTSMSTTVATPVAIATHLVLSGQFVTPGIQTPIIPELYNPILDELERLGMKFQETFEAVA